MAHEQFDSCISACDACATACDRCAASCLSEGHATEMAECIKRDIDCAALCRLASAAMARGSRHAKSICSLCAEVCEACAAECAQHDADHCKECAEACRKCANECKSMG